MTFYAQNILSNGFLPGQTMTTIIEFLLLKKDIILTRDPCTFGKRFPFLHVIIVRKWILRVNSCPRKKGGTGISDIYFDGWPATIVKKNVCKRALRTAEK